MKEILDQIKAKAELDFEDQQHRADLDIVAEKRHKDFSVYHLAHGRGAVYTAFKLQPLIHALVECLEKAIEQRDGYRSNYWAHLSPCKFDDKEIREDNDRELTAILERGLK